MNFFMSFGGNVEGGGTRHNGEVDPVDSALKPSHFFVMCILTSFVSKMHVASPSCQPLAFEKCGDVDVAVSRLSPADMGC
jgi:hypothetical protein